MKNNNILSLYKLPNTVFSMKDIVITWKETDMNNAKARVNYYVRTGKLHSPRKGFYTKGKEYNRMELAAKIYTPSYISFETVLIREGIIFQYEGAITVASYLSRTIESEGNKIIYRKIKNGVLLSNAGMDNKDNVSMASKERAFLDTVYLYKNYHFDNLKSLDWNLCGEIASIYDSKRLLYSLEEYIKNA